MCLYISCLATAMASAPSVISFAGWTCFAGHAAFPAKYGGSRLLLFGAASLWRQGRLVSVRSVASEQEVKEAAGDEREGFSGGVCGSFVVFCWGIIFCVQCGGNFAFSDCCFVLFS